MTDLLGLPSSICKKCNEKVFVWLIAADWGGKNTKFCPNCEGGKCLSYINKLNRMNYIQRFFNKYFGWE